MQRQHTLRRRLLIWSASMKAVLWQDLQFMLLAATGFAYGKEYMISVNSVHINNTMFENKPNGPNQNGPGLIFARPRVSRQMTGIA